MKAFDNKQELSFNYCVKLLNGIHEFNDFYEFNLDEKSKIIHGYNYMLVSNDNKLHAFINDNVNYNIMKRHIDIMNSNIQLNESKFVIESNSKKNSVFSQKALCALESKLTSCQADLEKSGLNDFHFSNQSNVEEFFIAHILVFGQEHLKNALKNNGPNLYIVNKFYRPFSIVRLAYNSRSTINRIKSFINERKINIKINVDNYGWSLKKSDLIENTNLYQDINWFSTIELLSFMKLLSELEEPLVLSIE